MDKTELFTAITKSINTLTDAWVIKLIASFLIAVITNLHTQLLLVFSAVVILDLLTKWYSLTRKYLIDTNQNYNALKCFKSMRAAQRAGYIQSAPMKHRFLGKIVTYITIVFGAAMTDFIMHRIGQAEIFVVAVVGYLAATEFLSILENLQNAGVEEAGKLKEIVERKGGLK